MSLRYVLVEERVWNTFGYVDIVVSNNNCKEYMG